MDARVAANPKTKPAIAVVGRGVRIVSNELFPAIKFPAYGVGGAAEPQVMPAVLGLQDLVVFFTLLGFVVL